MFDVSFSTYPYTIHNLDTHVSHFENLLDPDQLGINTVYPSAESCILIG